MKRVHDFGILASKKVSMVLPDFSEEAEIAIQAVNVSHGSKP